MRQVLILTFLIAILISCGSTVSENNDNKKEFEGVIKYYITAESKTPNLSTSLLQQLYGDTMTFYIKKGNYKMAYNGTDIRNIFYVSKINKEYTLRNNIDTLFVSSGDTETRQLVNTTFEQGIERIMNRECNKIINDLGNTKNNYWFDPTIYINPDHFKNHKFSYLNIYYDKAKSPWLKYKYEGSSFNLTYTAIELNERAVNDTTFKLPKLPVKTFE